MKRSIRDHRKIVGESKRYKELNLSSPVMEEYFSWLEYTTRLSEKVYARKTN